MRSAFAYALICVACPLAIMALAEAHGFDRLGSDNDYRVWPIHLVNGLFCLDLFATIGLVMRLRRRWWMGVLAAVPMLLLTAILAVTGGMWIDGAYF